MTSKQSSVLQEISIRYIITITVTLYYSTVIRYRALEELKTEGYGSPQFKKWGYARLHVGLTLVTLKLRLCTCRPTLLTD